MSTSPSTVYVPSFICIGGQRCGTTWLYKNLAKHKEIFLPPVKEVHYFDMLDNSLEGSSQLRRRAVFRHRFSWIKSILLGLSENSNLTHDLSFWKNYFLMDGSLESYKSFFHSATFAGKVTGDITPAYSTLDLSSIKQIRSLNPDLKIIYILRNPIDRSYSQLARDLASKGMKLEDLSQREIFDFFKSENCFSRSDYPTTLEKYRSYFNDDEMLVCFFEEISEDPYAFLKKICEFIRVTPLDKSMVADEAAYSKTYLMGKMSPEIFDFLAEQHRENIVKMGNLFGSYALEWHKQLISTQP